MNKLKDQIWLIGLGCLIVIWGYSAFAQKEQVNSLHEDIKIIQSDVKALLAR